MLAPIIIIYKQIYCESLDGIACATDLKNLFQTTKMAMALTLACGVQQICGNLLVQTTIQSLSYCLILSGLINS